MWKDSLKTLAENYKLFVLRDSEFINIPSLSAALLFLSMMHSSHYIMHLT
jgi:hypothetical protein